MSCTLRMFMLALVVVVRPSISLHTLQSLPPQDVYTQRPLPPKHYSKEHLIPRRLFRRRAHADDLWNMAPCDRRVNGIRSNFRYGNPFSDHFDRLDPKSLRPVYDNADRLSGHIHPQTRTFYPADNADFGLLGRSILRMLWKYPYLHQHLYAIVDSRSTIVSWCTLPMTDFERLRHACATQNDHERI